MTTKVLLKDVRISFPNIYVPKSVQDSKDERYSSSFLFAADHPCVALVTNAMREAAKGKWDGKAKEIYEMLKAADKLAIHNGNGKSQYEGFAGMLYINASNKTRPIVLDGDKAPLTQADGKPYAGCYVNAMIELWAQDNKYGKRINASLLGIQFLRDGQPLAGGGVASADDFEAVENPDVFGDEKTGDAPASENPADPW